MGVAASLMNNSTYQAQMASPLSLIIDLGLLDFIYQLQIKILLNIWLFLRNVFLQPNNILQNSLFLIFFN